MPDPVGPSRIHKPIFYTVCILSTLAVQHCYPAICLDGESTRSRLTTLPLLKTSFVCIPQSRLMGVARPCNEAFNNSTTLTLQPVKHLHHNPLLLQVVFIHHICHQALSRVSYHRNFRVALKVALTQVTFFLSPQVLFPMWF